MALITVGSPAPAFKVPNLTGPEINLESYKGVKPVVILFSSSRIDPAQIAGVRDIWKKNKEKVEVISISYKLPGVSAAKTFMMQLGAKFPATFDPDQKLYKLYGVENPIAVVGVNKDGNVAFVQENIDSKDTKPINDAIAAITA
jgi:peroxiredoxin